MDQTSTRRHAKWADWSNKNLLWQDKCNKHFKVFGDLCKEKPYIYQVLLFETNNLGEISKVGVCDVKIEANRYIYQSIT